MCDYMWCMRRGRKRADFVEVGWPRSARAGHPSVEISTLGGSLFQLQRCTLHRPTTRICRQEPHQTPQNGSPRCPDCPHGRQARQQVRKSSSEQQEQQAAAASKDSGRACRPRAPPLPALRGAVRSYTCVLSACLPMGASGGLTRALDRPDLCLSLHNPNRKTAVVVKAQNKVAQAAAAAAVATTLVAGVRKQPHQTLRRGLILSCCARTGGDSNVLPGHRAAAAAAVGAIIISAPSPPSHSPPHSAQAADMS